ncbi:MAG: proton-translocating transhydrogenase family protein [Gammaproteobacteria bacterium]|jgi:NAD(P) transhydrogenase subunit alpha
MSELMVALYVFVLACFIGYWVIWNVTSSLHTPLISLTNAISGIIIVGALLVAGFDEMGMVGAVIGFCAVLLASINIFGGFLVTQRMLRMFKKKKKAG